MNEVRRVLTKGILTNSHWWDGNGLQPHTICLLQNISNHCFPPLCIFGGNVEYVFERQFPSRGHCHATLKTICNNKNDHNLQVQSGRYSGKIAERLPSDSAFRVKISVQPLIATTIKLCNKLVFIFLKIICGFCL